MSNLAEIEVTNDLSEIAYYIDKCSEQSNVLNEKLGYTNVIRCMQYINLKVVNGNKKSSIMFVDMGDYEKL